MNGLTQEQVKAKFNRAADVLISQGYVAVSPISIYQSVNDWQEATRDNIKTMLECDELHLLPCWQESRSAQLKRDIALRLGMHIKYM